MIFCLIGEEDSDSELDSSVVHESEPYKEVSDFFTTFCTPQHGKSKICISRLKWSECRL